MEARWRLLINFYHHQVNTNEHQKVSGTALAAGNRAEQVAWASGLCFETDHRPEAYATNNQGTTDGQRNTDQLSGSLE